MTQQPVSTGATQTSRRDFLKAGSAAVAAGALAASTQVASGAFAGGSDVIRVGLIGCGNRGNGAAAQALNADPHTKLVAVGDTFADQFPVTFASLRKALGKRYDEQVAVDRDHQFAGFDAFQKVIEASDVVLLTTPPHFRPQHLRAAIEAGKHVFCEKPVAVDAPGCRSVKETVAMARKKKLAIVSGLCWRYHPSIMATFDQVKSGAIGDITAMRCSYFTRGLWTKPRKENWSDMEWQVRNWLYFTWLSGDHIVEQHVHSIDKMVWAMGDDHPISCTATGGRQSRTDKKYGHIYDHFACEFEFKNNVTAFSRCRQQDGCHPDVTDTLFGTKGICKIASSRTRIEKHDGSKWSYRGKSGNMYQLEHNELFKSIRNGTPINNGDYMTTSTMMAILGRMAAYTGREITWDKAWNSTDRLGPEKYEWTSLATPPVAIPGV